MAWRGKERVVSEKYHFDISHAGFIIGPKGAYIQSLKERPGVISIFLDTKAFRSKCVLIVKAKTKDACEAICNDIQTKITARLNTNRYATFFKTYLKFSGKNNQLFLSQYWFGSNVGVVPSSFARPIYTFARVESVSLEDHFANIDASCSTQRQNDFQRFSYDDVQQLFKRSLKAIDFEKIHKLKFHVSAGKTVFVSTRDDNSTSEMDMKSIYVRQDGSMNLKQVGLKPVYITLLSSCLREEIFWNVESRGFSHLNKNAPEAYTVVHLFVEDEKSFVTVKLALNKNLQAISNESDDLRLSPEKKTAIQHAFTAFTIGEVFENTTGSSVQVKYRKLHSLLHPDKNAHLGAEEAYKILQHAYSAVLNGEHDSTPSLQIQMPTGSVRVKPPKVLKVKTDRNKVSTATVFSPALVDVRASIKTHSLDTAGLSKRVRTVLNECWEKRDSKGGIPSPDGKTGIYIECVKQVRAVNFWGKEVSTPRGLAFLEIKMKELRMRTKNRQEWNEGLEVDMKVVYADEKKNGKKYNSKEMVKTFRVIRDEWKHVCPHHEDDEDEQSDGEDEDRKETDAEKEADTETVSTKETLKKNETVNENEADNDSEAVKDNETVNETMKINETDNESETMKINETGNESGTMKINETDNKNETVNENELEKENKPVNQNETTKKKKRPRKKKKSTKKVSESIANSKEFGNENNTSQDM